MSTGKEKLQQDLKILTAMADDMNAYLINDALFRQIAQGMPKLTLGGYLMREHRLLALRDDLLDPEAQTQLDTAITQANQTFQERRTYIDQKLHKEVDARLRQWSQYLTDLADGQGASRYATAVEPRAMISALEEKSGAFSITVDVAAVEKIDALDQRLKQRWQSGTFVWPSAWEPAYPPEDYWWLHGNPGK